MCVQIEMLLANQKVLICCTAFRSKYRSKEKASMIGNLIYCVVLVSRFWRRPYSFSYFAIWREN